MQRAQVGIRRCRTRSRIDDLPWFQQRQLAIEERTQGCGIGAATARVMLCPGGRLALADFRHTRDYASRLRERGLEPSVRGFGWRFWYGGPWAGTSLVTATKPG